MKNEEWRLQDVNQKHKAGYLLKSMLLQHESVTKLYKDLTNQKIIELYWQQCFTIEKTENFF